MKVYCNFKIYTDINRVIHFDLINSPYEDFEVALTDANKIAIVANNLGNINTDMRIDDVVYYGNRNCFRFNIPPNTICGVLIEENETVPAKLISSQNSQIRNNLDPMGSELGVNYKLIELQEQLKLMENKQEEFEDRIINTVQNMMKEDTIKDFEETLSQWKLRDKNFRETTHRNHSMLTEKVSEIRKSVENLEVKTSNQLQSVSNKDLESYIKENNKRLYEIEDFLSTLDAKKDGLHNLINTIAIRTTKLEKELESISTQEDMTHLTKENSKSLDYLSEDFNKRISALEKQTSSEIEILDLQKDGLHKLIIENRKKLTELSTNMINNSADFGKRLAELEKYYYGEDIFGQKDKFSGFQKDTINQVKKTAEEVKEIQENMKRFIQGEDRFDQQIRDRLYVVENLSGSMDNKIIELMKKFKDLKVSVETIDLQKDGLHKLINDLEKRLTKIELKIKNDIISAQRGVRLKKTITF